MLCNCFCVFEREWCRKKARFLYGCALMDGLVVMLCRLSSWCNHVMMIIVIIRTILINMQSMFELGKP